MIEGTPNPSKKELEQGIRGHIGSKMTHSSMLKALDGKICVAEHGINTLCPRILSEKYGKHDKPRETYNLYFNLILSVSSFNYGGEVKL